MRKSIKRRFATTTRSATLSRRPYGKGRHSESRRRHLVAVHQTLRTGKQSHSLAARANQLVCFKSEIAWAGMATTRRKEAHAG